jgi:glycerophosphoryl diester phosphodiesterase
MISSNRKTNGKPRAPKTPWLLSKRKWKKNKGIAILDLLIPNVVAHRGLPYQAPENSLEGLLLIQQKGIPGVEIDIQPTRDGQWVLCHDLSLERTTGTDALVRDLDSRDIGGIRLKNGETLPIFFEALRILSPQTFLNVEIKWPFQRPIPFLDRLFSSLKKHRFRENTLLTSFNPGVLRSLKKAGCQFPVGLIYGDIPQVPPFLRQGLGRWFCRADYLSVCQDNLLYTSHKPQEPYLVWTVNETLTAKRLLKGGARGIISDQADLILKEM